MCVRIWRGVSPVSGKRTWTRSRQLVELPDIFGNLSKLVMLIRSRPGEEGVDAITRGSGKTGHGNRVGVPTLLEGWHHWPRLALRTDRSSVRFILSDGLGLVSLRGFSPLLSHLLLIR